MMGVLPIHLFVTPIDHSYFKTVTTANCHVCGGNSGGRKRI